MIEPTWLLEETIIFTHKRLLEKDGGISGIRDHNLLLSALARPLHLFHYVQDVTVFRLAAAYTYGLTKNHAFFDGNKRVGFAALYILLELNGWLLVANTDDCVNTIQRIAASQMTEEQLTAWIAQHSLRQD